MRKLKLDLDAIEVESFATARPPSTVGTVRGHTDDPQCGSVNMSCDPRGLCFPQEPNDPNAPTGEATCNWTCWANNNPCYNNSYYWDTCAATQCMTNACYLSCGGAC